MVVVRNRISAIRAGGPRQFAELRDKLLVKVDNSAVTEDVLSELKTKGLTGEALNNAPVITAEPENKIENVIERVTDGRPSTKVRQGINEIRRSRREGEDVVDITSSAIEATQRIITSIGEINDVKFAEFVKTEADYGPQNLRMSIDSMETLSPDDARNKSGNMDVLNENLNLPTAWQETKGENAIVAVFDTGFAKGLIDEERIVDTFHAGGTDSVYESGEGHGTMCVGAAAANKEKEGVPFNGAAPEAGVILVRITDDEGQIRGDIISKGWDWLMDVDADRPIVANHSYGTPLCSGRPKQKFCGTAVNDVVKIATSSPDITAVYAAGNEAMRCGHRPSGITSAVTGTNSMAEVITVGALLTNGREAQRYSSHGRGDCAPIADPKPNVSAPIPMNTYYGTEDGWKIKDMSTGPFGSGGGTSHASPTTAGMIALLQSKAVKMGGLPEEANGSARSRGDNGAMQTEEIKQILHSTAEQPHANQINKFSILFSEKGYDARFGNGQVKVNRALSEV